VKTYVKGVANLNLEWFSWSLWKKEEICRTVLNSMTVSRATCVARRLGWSSSH